ncbi:MAG: hypothetical protein LBG80_17300 [Bacteroidales bacterium]|jgi:hypothetical protein|nr:hypothetical protein [Bacteroidales bacterium]
MNKSDNLKNEILVISKTLSTIVNDIKHLGLMSGKMGYCIYFYHASIFAKEKQYNVIADQLLDSICKEADEKISLDIPFGLAGIGLGIDYLIKRRYVEGNINDVLEKIDIPVFNMISFKSNQLPVDFRIKIQLLYYCYVRLQCQKDKSDGCFIFEHIIFKLLNSIIQFSSELWEEPYSFSLRYQLPFFLYILGLLSTINTFRDKIRKMTDEITHYVISQIPVSHAHRLYLIWGMSYPVKEFNLSSWEKHIQLLKREIDVTHILNNEFEDKNIFLEEGISGVLLLLILYNDSVNNEDKIKYDVTPFINKIASSATWMRLKNDIDFLKMNSGLNGFCGISLIINYIKEINL